MPNLDDFTKHYIIAALWSTPDETSDGGATFLQDHHSIDDLAPDALEKIKADCAKFQTENAALLTQAYALYKPHPDAPTPQCSAGHDFWLTRNGHGVGFWDRGFNQLGEDLSAAAKAFGEMYIYAGDDGKLYV